MSAEVAVVFKQYFDEPALSQRVTNHLALQNNHQGAAVYNLITKPAYYGKPTAQDYNTAFKDLAIDFKRKGLKNLICSPIGTVRDLVQLNHFVANLKKFYQYTKAKITIVSYPQESYRTLRNGLSHGAFNEKLLDLINSKSSFLDETTNTPSDIALSAFLHFDRGINNTSTYFKLQVLMV